MSKEPYTPMMMQYLEVKKNLQDCIVFYRLGDFYEMFFEDAHLASNALDLVLTGRSAGAKEKIPMCGIPYHAANGYIQRLTQKGFKVAIVEQMSDPSAGKIVERGVVRIVTPGTIMNDEAEDTTTRYLASIYDYHYGFAFIFCEMSYGELSAITCPRTLEDVRKTLLSYNVKEVVVPPNFDKEYEAMIKDFLNLSMSVEEDVKLKPEYLTLIEEIDDEHIRKSFACLSNYLDHTQRRHMSHLNKVELIHTQAYLQMDYSTKLNLELVAPLRTGSKSETLWGFMDHTLTSMGSRLLKKWISYPLLEKKIIEKRQDAITFLNHNFLLKDELKDALKKMYDMERLSAKIAYGSANPRDMLRLISSLGSAPEIFHLFATCEAYQEFKRVDCLSSLYGKIKDIFVSEPPIHIKDGGIFCEGYNETLDDYRTIDASGKDYILALEASERERTGIGSLKIGYNRIFGYYIEVRSGNVDKIKEEFGYERKQTLANAERYVTQELKEKEDAILHAQEKALRLEATLYASLLEELKVYVNKLHTLSQQIAEVDALYSLSVVSQQSGYVAPSFNHEHVVEVEEARHPILDQRMNKQRYISNGLHMKQEDQILLITGPNMGGKSTYMRQVALVVVMAQVGCYVPALSANLPIFDRIFTRIGASDDIMSGHSTFMVEMMEANDALQHATDNSLILFDEIGRGTSTYDGMSLAYAMLEYLQQHTKAKTLFSTHYHELTSLEDTYPSIKNMSVAVEEENNEVIFLYKMKMGKADKSYGVNVARLAKLPKQVIDRATQMLKHIEKDTLNLDIEDVPVVEEDSASHEVLELLDQANVDAMTPLDALLFLNELKKKR